MTLIQWNEELCVGINQVDEEHQQLVAIVNQLDEAMTSGKGTRIMGEILAQLVQYTKVHFESEEELMADANFPDLDLHRKQHRQLVQKVEKFQRDFNHSGRRITREMMDFLRYWLANHILVDDKAFGRFCTSAGLSPTRVLANG